MNLKPLHHIDESGGINSDTTPSVFCVNRGHFAWTETDNFPDPLNPQQLMTSVGYMLWGTASMVREKLYSYPIGGVPSEPLTSFFPEVGPNAHLLLRKVRKVFDLNRVAAPGRQVFTEEEFKNVPEEVLQLINSIRAKHGMKAV